ncbi:MAG: three-Cys-motif partner protein TcmP [Stenotrophomonas nitritireducens]|uniref:three-Cys-motif partner protein TcmP n=1 Tax=Stenotrophomonas nitritireducens TaxID=83617 RepID=UPI001AD1C9F3|nr:three-Cys-motif partner protein TcmP [Stenotrophomonas nitritireducens]MBN8768976.1 three-Cys-motif partner protein TcmP [Stenotrophomonas sp.]MBN8793014.1 three-Cys-motif partner protein TcmP [Stenotrophomonas nitritireducens]
MTESRYLWDGYKPAIIKQHSVAKHEVLREYLVAYLQTLVASPGQEAISLTLIDGFAGGGLYVHEDTGRPVLGSPFVFLEAAREAEALLSLGRKKPLEFKLDYFFVEKQRQAHAFLLKNLTERGYGDRLGHDIHALQGTFEHHYPSILSFIRRKNPRAGRSIFLLDQYGYKDVPTSQIRQIFEHLPRAEVILTFAVDSFINFASDNPATTKQLKRLDIPDLLKGRTFEDIKSNEKDVRLYIQSCMYQALVAKCGAKYFTVFFIRTTGHGDYWLVHLSQHPRARDVMTTVHWNNNTHFIHYGGAGLEMFRTLGYAAREDAEFTGQGELGFCFDERASHASIRALAMQISPLVHAKRDGLTFGELFSNHCNSSPADSARYRLAIEKLIEHKELVVVSESGAHRRSASTIVDRDLLKISNQTSFWNFN